MNILNFPTVRAVFRKAIERTQNEQKKRIKIERLEAWLSESGHTKAEIETVWEQEKNGAGQTHKRAERAIPQKPGTIIHKRESHEHQPQKISRTKEIRSYQPHENRNRRSWTPVRARGFRMGNGRI